MVGRFVQFLSNIAFEKKNSHRNYFYASDMLEIISTPLKFVINSAVNASLKLYTIKLLRG